MSGQPPTPKRGAFPTPKDVREKTPPYVPDHDAVDDQQDDATNRSPDRTQLPDGPSDKDTKQK